VVRAAFLTADVGLPHLLQCAPFLCRVEIKSLTIPVGTTSLRALQTLRSLPQITWQPLVLQLKAVAWEVCAALDGTPLAQAVSELVLFGWEIEPPIAALRALFPHVLDFALCYCPQSMTSSLIEAITAWPMLRRFTMEPDSVHTFEAAQQHLEAAARMAAEHKAGQPFEIALLSFFAMSNSDVVRLDALVAAVRRAGVGKVDVRRQYYDITGSDSASD